MNITWTFYFLCTSREKCQKIIEKIDLEMKFLDIDIVEPYEKGETKFRGTTTSCIDCSSLSLAHYKAMCLAKILSDAWTVTIPSEEDWVFDGAAKSIKFQGVSSVSFTTSED